MLSPVMGGRVDFWTAVEQVLLEAGGALHARDIAEALKARELWQSSSRTPVASVTSMLARDVKQKGQASRVRRTSIPNTFELNPDYRDGKRSRDASSAIGPPDERRGTARARHLSFADAAEVVLWRFGNGQPMHYRDITKLALLKKLVRSRGKTPEATLYARIIDEGAAAAKRGEEPRFVRHGKGLVGLAAWGYGETRPGMSEPIRSSATSAGRIDVGSERVSARLAPIEASLRATGWAICDAEEQRAAGPVAVRNVRIGGRVLDYALYLDGRLLAFVELKVPAVPVRLVESQLFSLAADVREVMGLDEYSGLVYLINGAEMFFMRLSGERFHREVADFHRPEALLREADEPQFRIQVARMPTLDLDRLWAHQVESLNALEASLAAGDRRALLQLPSGAGSLAIATAESFRLLRHTSARRVLYLADSRAGATSAKSAFEELETPIGRFGDLFSIALDDPQLPGPAPAHVVVMTVQRLLRFVASGSGSERVATDPLSLGDLPIDAFDFIWCQNSRSVSLAEVTRLLDRFDAPIVGFASAPSPETAAYFDGNLIIKLGVEDLVREGVVKLKAARSGGDRQHDRDQLTPASFLLRFLQHYLDGRGAQVLVDPAATGVSLPWALLDVGAATRATAFSASGELAADPRIEWVKRDLITGPAKELTAIGEPELIVSLPPFGLPRRAQSLRTSAGRSVEVVDEPANVLLLTSSRRLELGGEAIFLLGPSFLFPGRANARALLGELGLHVHAMLSVERGLVQSSIPLNVVFVRREPVEATFVGRLSERTDAAQLLSNLRRRRRGAVPELGRLVEWRRFRNYEALVAEEKVATLLADTGLETVSLAEILAAPVKRIDDAAVPDADLDENALYMSRRARGSVHRRFEEIAENQRRSYYRLELDPARASADYVALMLGTPLGRALREASGVGGTAQWIPPSSVAHLQVPLPELAVQREVSRTHGQIGSFRLELDGLERRLAKDPGAVRRVAAALARIGERDPLTTLRETLPFPLASILWRYEAEVEVAAKVEHLHAFFEASAIYFATVLLSAFFADQELLEQERKRWCLRPGSLERATFGSWTFLGERMAASMRRLTQQAGARKQTSAAFALDAERFIDVLSSSELWALLGQALAERNRSKGHGGILGPQAREDLHVRLSGLLIRFGGLLGGALGEVQLVRPGAAKLRGGVGYYERAEVLRGPHTIFQRARLDRLPHMDSDELYLVASEAPAGRDVLQLLPFVCLQAARHSSENACYFYSRLDGDAAEFVSYHFEAEPRLTLAESGIGELLARFVWGKGDR